MFTKTYFGATYFSPMYFAASTAGIVVTVPPPPGPRGYRDRNAFAAIVAALESTGEFAAVLLGSPAYRTLVGADRTPMAVISPTEWDEEDDADPIFNVRHVSYLLTLICRGEIPGERYEQLDRLTSVVQNALDGSNLDGGCLPALTKFRRGRPDLSARHPEQRILLEGEFTYLISTQAGHDTTA